MTPKSYYTNFLKFIKTNIFSDPKYGVTECNVLTDLYRPTIGYTVNGTKCRITIDPDKDEGWVIQIPDTVMTLNELSFIAVTGAIFHNQWSYYKWIGSQQNPPQMFCQKHWDIILNELKIHNMIDTVPKDRFDACVKTIQFNRATDPVTQNRLADMSSTLAMFLREKMIDICTNEEITQYATDIKDEKRTCICCFINDDIWIDHGAKYVHDNVYVPIQNMLKEADEKITQEIETTQ